MSFLYRIIPAKVHNRIVALAYDLTALIGVPEKTSRVHFEENVKALQRVLRTSKNGFIENQAQLKDVRFGKRHTMSEAGCGAIAVINAKRALGEDVPAKKAAAIISALERRGAALQGRIGISPLAIVRFLRHEGYAVRTFFAKDLGRARLHEAEYDTFIVSCYNNERNMGDKLHTVNIERRENGYVIHNAYRYDAQAKRYTESIAYPSLADAVTHIDPVYASQPIAVTGIRKIIH